MIKRKKCIYTIENVEGLFSTYNSLLAFLDYCLTNGYVPFTRTTDQFLYKTSDDHERHLDYFFSLSEIYEEEYEIDGEVYINNSTLYRNKSYMRYPKDIPRSIEIRKYNYKLSSYIHIRKDIIDEADVFFKNNFENKRVIGAHIRCTDRMYQLINYTKTDTNGSIELYKKHIIDNFPCDYVYIATDDSFIIPMLKMYRSLKNKLIYRNVIRSSDGYPIHFKNHEGMQLGTEVLIDALILSRCDHLICSYSSIASAVLCWNPYLPYTNLAHMVTDTHDFFGK